MGPAAAPEISADCPLRAPLCCALSTTPDQEEEDEGEGEKEWAGCIYTGRGGRLLRGVLPLTFSPMRGGKKATRL
jgi:hypothetical protein